MKDIEEIEFYKISDVISYSYYPVPQELFINPLYMDELSLEAKMLYAFLTNRFNLSLKNNWTDSNNRIYLIYTREKAAKMLRVSYKTIIKAFKELIKAKLIMEKKQGQGKPNLIYIGKMRRIKQICKDVSSLYEEEGVLDVSNLHTNNTNSINTDNINPQSENITLEEIRLKCNLNDFENKEKCILNDVINKLYNSTILKINGLVVSQTEIKDKLKLITKDNLIHLVDVIKSNSNIKNLNSYLVSTLYNNLGNSYTKVNKKESSFDSRIYDESYLNKLYCNVEC